MKVLLKQIENIVAKGDKQFKIEPHETKYNSTTYLISINT